MSLTTTSRVESTYALITAIPSGLPSNLMGAKVTLTLYELTTAKSASSGQVQTYTGVQTMEGSLQPLSARESVLYSKETLSANYAFYVGNSVFINSTNEGKLVEKNRLTYGSRVFDIVFVENRTEGNLAHYKVLLSEVV